MNTKNYESWGRYPKLHPSEVIQLFWRSELPDFKKFNKSLLCYAFGKSYGDSCLNDNSILLDVKGLSRLISFDSVNGVIRCEAGVTLAAILDFISPKGWFLSATPGTKFISVGGAIANDVHGKNHHKGGTFGCHVTRFELVRSGGERIVCSPDENVELFKATIGGLGLTGMITWAEFKLKPSPTPFFAVENIKFDSLDEFFEINEESEKKYDYTVAWVDTTASGANFGRGIYNRGNQANPEIHNIPKIPVEKLKPFPFDAAFINPSSVFLFNMLYFNKQNEKYQSGIVHYNPFFYPLDAVLNWNKAYGKKGFVQYQFVIPFENGKKNIKNILKYISKTGMSSFLTVLKTFGDVKSPGMLSFPRPGITMAIDFRMNGESTLKLCDELDEFVRNAGGVLYPAKDARMHGSDFRKFYPQWKEFKDFIDPKFSSSFWRRVMS